MRRLQPPRSGQTQHSAPSGPTRIVTAVRRIPARAASYAPFPDGLEPRLIAGLASRGITQLYAHQAESIDHIRAGRDLVIVTPTASGKTLCYNGPVLDAMLRDPSARALYLFPTKALAQDQLAELHALVELVSSQDAESVAASDRGAPAPLRLASSPTTATRRRTRGARFARARTSS